MSTYPSFRMNNIQEYGVRGYCKDLSSKEEFMKCAEAAYDLFEKNEKHYQEYDDHLHYSKTIDTLHFYLVRGLENHVYIGSTGYAVSRVDYIEQPTKEATNAQ